MKDVLTVEDLTYVYSRGTPFEKVAVDHVNFHAEKGEFIGLIGHTGSGKSTLIQHFNGLLKPASGRVLINGEDIHASRELTRGARFAVGLVFQYPEYQLFEETVRADIAFGPKNMGLEQKEINRRVEEAAAIVGLPRAVLDQSPFDLSGGQKRRVALAGVFAMEPEVLVLDEPMAGLDPAGRDDVFGFISDYHKKNGTTVIFVTHSMEDAAKMASRIVVMEQARVLMEGTPREVFGHAERLIEAGLNVPQVTRVFLELKRCGAEVPTDIYTVQQALEALRARKKGVGAC